MTSVFKKIFNYEDDLSVFKGIDANRIACNTIVLCGNKILLGCRRKKYAKGMWCLPGGHLNLGESLDKCFSRELYEEVGVVGSGQVPFLIVEEVSEKYIFYHFFAYLRIKRKRAGWFVNKEPKNFSCWLLFDYKDIPDEMITSHRLAADYLFSKNRVIRI
ncbi:MAG: NUDIX hydrolase [Candidatus Moranbacteria bacterium]|nr:NUDIX hydrolase [Candidatus Moranbacteria bacterium]MDD3964836.1 NUDIX hydrolase [Candidatus Moranbacteria bacterium]